MPPKPKKKPGKNGFWQFMMEYRSKSRKTFKDNEELAAAAGVIWKDMSTEEREPYMKLARITRNNFSNSKLTSDGVEIDQIEKENREKQFEIEQMKADINKTISDAVASLQEQQFFIIHINHLFYHHSRHRHYICEISIAPFTLRSGVDCEKVFHRTIMPGRLPLGYYHEAKNHSEQTHNLFDIVHKDPPEDTNESVFKDMIKFLEKNYHGTGFPPLYSEYKRMELCNRVMSTWCGDFLRKSSSDLKIYNLQYMFYVLRNAAAGSAVWPSETFSYMQLEKDLFSHDLTLTCEYHSVIENSVYCSKAIATRYAYTICDNCCVDLGIEVMPGYHIPQGNKEREVENLIKRIQESVTITKKNVKPAASSTLSDDTIKSSSTEKGDGLSQKSYSTLFGTAKMPSTSRNFSQINFEMQREDSDSESDTLSITYDSDNFYNEMASSSGKS